MFEKFRFQALKRWIFVQGCQLILQIRRPESYVTPGFDSANSRPESPGLDLFNSAWDLQSIDYGIEDPALSSGTQEVGNGDIQDVPGINRSLDIEPTDKIVTVTLSTEVKS
jgi:hypothetical protein